MLMKYLAVAVLALGAGIVAWMGSTFMVANTLALLVIVAIALCYLAGIVELVRFHRDTTRLASALSHLSQTGVDLDQWLTRLPTAFQNPVRLRIRGDVSALPSLVMTPHLTGLLVMLGLLGTFVGMVVTLQGAVAALEHTAELEAIRSAMTAPIKGLGLAFGTSVAGVSASAALGFVATLWRRERQRVTRDLEARTASAFRSHSLPAYREQILAVLQSQAAAIPELVERLTGHGRELEHFLQRIDESLTAGQERFHEQMLTIHHELADSVGGSLRQSLADGGRLAGESIRPAVDEAMAALVTAGQETQLAVRDAAHQQVQAVVQHLESTSTKLNGEWLAGLGQLVDGIGQLRRDTSEAAARDEALLAQQAASLTQIDELVALLSARSEAQQHQLGEQARAFGETAEALAARLDRHGQEQGERAAQAQMTLIDQLSDHYRQLTRQMGEEFCGAVAAHSRETLAQVEPLWRDAMAALSREAAGTQAAVAQLVERQADAMIESTQQLQTTLGEQWAAALVQQRDAQAGFLEDAATAVAALREQFQNINTQIAGDLTALRDAHAESRTHEAALREEQAALGQQLAHLVDTMQSRLGAQHDALSGFVANAEALFAASSQRTEQQLEQATAQLSTAADDFAAGVAELAGLGDALAQWAAAFATANEQLKTAADQLESAVLASAQRSDEQMGYYVAQAREVVDYSVQAQQALIDQMRQLARPV